MTRLSVCPAHGLSITLTGRPKNNNHRRAHFSPGTTIPKLNTTVPLGIRPKIRHSHRAAKIAYGALNSAATAYFYRYLIEVPTTKIRQLASTSIVPMVVSCVLSQPTSSVSKHYPTEPGTVTNLARRPVLGSTRHP